MPVIGFNFTSINANLSEKKISGDINVNSTPNIKNITKRELNIPGTGDVLSIEFNFITKYEPKIGEVSISGEVLYQTEETKKILNLWKDKKLETQLAIDVLNAIFRKCITKAVQLTDDLRLPPPLTFPIVQTEGLVASRKQEKKSAA